MVLQQEILVHSFDPEKRLNLLLTQDGGSSEEVHRKGDRLLLH